MNSQEIPIYPVPGEINPHIVQKGLDMCGRF